MKAMDEAGLLQNTTHSDQPTQRLLQALELTITEMPSFIREASLRDHEECIQILQQIAFHAKNNADQRFKYYEPLHDSCATSSSTSLRRA